MTTPYIDVTKLGVQVIATMYHCDQEWRAAGRLHNGFFRPNRPDYAQCPTCGTLSNSYVVEGAPLPEPLPPENDNNKGDGNAA